MDSLISWALVALFAALILLGFFGLATDLLLVRRLRARLARTEDRARFLTTANDSLVSRLDATGASAKELATWKGHVSRLERERADLRGAVDSLRAEVDHWKAEAAKARADSFLSTPIALMPKSGRVVLRRVFVWVGSRLDRVWFSPAGDWGGAWWARLLGRLSIWLFWVQVRHLRDRH